MECVKVVFCDQNSCCRSLLWTFLPPIRSGLKVPIQFSALILCQWVGDSSYVGIIYAFECLSLVFIFNSMFNAYSPPHVYTIEDHLFSFKILLKVILIPIFLCCEMKGRGLIGAKFCCCLQLLSVDELRTMTAVACNEVPVNLPSNKIYKPVYKLYAVRFCLSKQSLLFKLYSPDS